MSQQVKDVLKQHDLQQDKFDELAKRWAVLDIDTNPNYPATLNWLLESLFRSRNFNIFHEQEKALRLLKIFISTPEEDLNFLLACLNLAICPVGDIGYFRSTASKLLDQDKLIAETIESVILE